ncbi:Reverse transcriptase-like [Sesbania bispinosa]|nr:Reverse transcriptase-like [Sesbania bispinosa]
MGNPGPTGFGGVLRKSDGSWILGYFGNLDSTHLITLIKEEEDLTYYEHASIILEIRQLLRRDWEVEIHHILREGNT